MWHFLTERLWSTLRAPYPSYHHCRLTQGLKIPFAAFQYSSGGLCDPQNILQYDSLSPGTAVPYTAWIVAQDVITLNNLSGTIPAMTFQPQVVIGCCQATVQQLRAYGPRVVACANGFFGDKDYYVAVSPPALPHEVNSIGSCVPVPGP